MLGSTKTKTIVIESYLSIVTRARYAYSYGTNMAISFHLIDMVLLHCYALYKNRCLFDNGNLSCYRRTPHRVRRRSVWWQRTVARNLGCGRISGLGDRSNGWWTRVVRVWVFRCSRRSGLHHPRIHAPLIPFYGIFSFVCH